MESANINFDIDHSLSRALGFDHRILMANKEGYMTKQQRETIRRAAYRQQIYMGLIAGILIIITLGSVLLEMRVYGRLFVSTPVLAFMLASIGLGALGTALLWSRRREFHDDLHKGVVHTVNGNVELKIISRNAFRADYKVCIAQHTFSVSKQVLLAFKHADRYRVYYAPSSMTLLSAEPINRS